MRPGLADADSATSPHRPANTRRSCQHRLSTALPLDLRTVPVEGSVNTLAGCELKGGAAVSNPNRQGGTPRSPVPGVITFTATQDGPRQFGTRGCPTHVLNQSAVRSGTPTMGNDRSPSALRSPHASPRRSGVPARSAFCAVVRIVDRLGAVAVASCGPGSSCTDRPQMRGCAGRRHPVDCVGGIRCRSRPCPGCWDATVSVRPSDRAHSR